MTQSDVRVVGRYELHAELAAGGMASVYLGRLIGAAGFAKSVAVKRLHAHMASDPEFVASLLQEARLAERVRHPNVVATIDVVAEEKELLLVMEYVHGETLGRLLRACNDAGEMCPPEIAARIVYDTLLGLHAAHTSTDATGNALCIVHRDVSPQNVMVGADGVTRLVDFGVAKALGSIGHTREGHLKGKIAYMAPELLRYEPPSPQSDVWAAAVVLWEARTGRRLFRGDSEVQVWGQVLTGEIPDPGTIVEPPTPLDDVIMRGLAREAADRPVSALAMAEDIERGIRLASPAEVAAWVAERAGPALEQRATLLRNVELADPTPRARLGPGSTPDSNSSSRGRRLGFVLFALAMFGAAGLTVRKWAMSDRGNPTNDGIAIAPPGSLIAPSIDAAVADAGLGERASGASDASTTGDASTTAELADASPARPSSSVATHPSRVPPHTPPIVRPPVPRADAASPPAPSVSVAAPPPSARPDCDPPFFVDATGRKRFKLECVKDR